MTLSSGNQAQATDVSPFGNESNGAFSESSGTTNIAQGDVQHYSTFLLDTSATLSASSTSTKPIIIKVFGNCTINGTVDLIGKGNIAGVGATPGGAYYTDGEFGGSGFGIATGGKRVAGGSTSIFGRKGGSLFNFQHGQQSFLMNGTGGGAGDSGGSGDTGGGGGASSTNDGAAGSANGATDSGADSSGGAGGGTFVLFVGGTLTFGASSTIDVSGAAGGSASGTGGGGGGSGDILIFHNGTLTDNGVTKTKGGGAGGTDTGDADANGGAGGAGAEIIVAYDTIFWSAAAYST